jgi:hypothetical protein
VHSPDVLKSPQIVHLPLTCAGKLEMLATKFKIHQQYLDRANEEAQLVKQEAEGAVISLEQQRDRLQKRLQVQPP